MNESGRETKRRRKEDEREVDSKDDVGLTLTQIAKMGNAYGHPYGVQLLGNRFASKTDTTPCSLGACFDRLGDVKMLQFLDTYVEDAKMLGKLAMVNRAFYVLSRTCFILFVYFSTTLTQPSNRYRCTLETHRFTQIRRSFSIQKCKLERDIHTYDNKTA